MPFSTPFEISPYDLTEGIAFAFFAIMIISCALSVILVRNPVYAVLLMVMAFFGSAALFVMQGAEFLGLLLIIVYVGAIAVLFLFVIMMLDVRLMATAKLQRKHLPIALLVSGLLFFELVAIVIVDKPIDKTMQESSQEITTEPAQGLLDNTTQLGLIIYSEYLLIFEIAGLALLLAMLGAIMLTHRKRDDNMRQNITLQRERSGKARLVNVETKGGV